MQNGELYKKPESTILTGHPSKKNRCTDNPNSGFQYIRKYRIGYLVYTESPKILSGFLYRIRVFSIH